MTDSRKFCLLTLGRAGSTALINALQRFDDIAVPNRNIDCPDNELVHPRHVVDYAQEYSRLCGREIRNVNELIDCYYAYNAASPYCGFKSMANRHSDFMQFVSRPDIRFITLVRDDIPSTAASFLIARLHGTWRRDGGKQRIKHVFSDRDKPGVLGNLQYIAHSLALLRRVPNAISLTYETLCSPDFNNPDLNDFFGRDIRLERPRAPTSAETYVSNWPVFSHFVNQTYAVICRELGAQTGMAPGDQRVRET